MGRRKIAMKPITQTSSRRATFEKRRIGLLKKAMELSILCSSTISVTIYNPDGDVYVYSSEPYENVVNKFREYLGSYKLLTNDHYDQMLPGKASSRSIGFTLVKQSESKVRQRLSLSQSLGAASDEGAADEGPKGSIESNNNDLFSPKIKGIASIKEAIIKKEPIDVDNKASKSTSRNSEKSNNSRKRKISEVLNTDISDYISNPFDSDRSINNKSFGFINTIIPITKNSNFGEKRIKLTKDFDSLDLNFNDSTDPNNQKHTQELDIKDNTYLLDAELNLDSINQSQFIM